MRKLNAVLISAAIALGAMASTDAFARGGFHGGFHHGGRVGVFIGAPLLFSPWYYPPAYYPAPYYPAPAYYPAPVAYPAAPTTYVEQAPAPEAAPAPRSDASWYYCPAAKAYYPYVNQCAGGWQRVSPQPPPS